VSSLLWAAVFLEIGRRLGRRTVQFFELLPAHLLPWVLLLIAIAVGSILIYEKRFGRSSPQDVVAPAKADQPS
jgi:membrane protein DedA with SNARE-associated domain